MILIQYLRFQPTQNDISKQRITLYLFDLQFSTKKNQPRCTKTAIDVTVVLGKLMHLPIAFNALFPAINFIPVKIINAPVSGEVCLDVTDAATRFANGIS